jgi:hypothetical protein
MGTPFLSSNPSLLVSTGPGSPVMNTVRPLSLPSVSHHLGLDGIHTITSEVGQWSGGAIKRKRETSLSQVQQSPFGSSAARSMPTLHEQYYGRPWEPRRNNPISSSDGWWIYVRFASSSISFTKCRTTKGGNPFWVFLGSLGI